MFCREFETWVQQAKGRHLQVHTLVVLKQEGILAFIRREMIQNKACLRARISSFFYKAEFGQPSHDSKITFKPQVISFNRTEAARPSLSLSPEQLTFDHQSLLLPYSNHSQTQNQFLGQDPEPVILATPVECL